MTRKRTWNTTKRLASRILASLNSMILSFLNCIIFKLKIKFCFLFFLIFLINFQSLSEDLFEECFESIYEELEDINDELASNMINNEFMVTDSPIERNESAHQSPRILSQTHKHGSKLSLNQHRIENTFYSSFQSNEDDSLTSISN